VSCRGEARGFFTAKTAKTAKTTEVNELPDLNPSLSS